MLTSVPTPTRYCTTNTLISSSTIPPALTLGDIVSIAGVFLPVRYSGFRAMKAGLIADTFLQAQHIFRHKKSYDE